MSASTSLRTPRRQFLQSAAAFGAGLAAAKLGSAAELHRPFKISLGEWSFHRALFSKRLHHLDVANVASEECGINALEYSAQFFMDKAENRKYLSELKQRALDAAVEPVLITVDDQGDIGDSDALRRLAAVEKHYKWVLAGHSLGCHSIRVNAFSDEKLSAGEQGKLVADGLRRLAEFAAPMNVNVLVENHGRLSSNAKWLTQVVKDVGLPNCGTLPDFGNFGTEPGLASDRYQGVAEMMPFAKGVSAKSYAFDAQGNETTIDYRKMLKIVRQSEFDGYLGIEHEGDSLSELDGVRATKRLIEAIGGEQA